MLQRSPDRAGCGLLLLGLAALAATAVVLRLPLVTDHWAHALVKDPERTVPGGRVIVAPADGTVVYVRKISAGMIPEVVKEGVAVPVTDYLKGEPVRPFAGGYLIGIYMNAQGVHINRMPNRGTIRRQIVWNGPHLNMSAFEAEIILTQLIPGRVTLRKLFGRPPFDIADHADFVLKSARETLAIEDERGAYLYIVRIADFYVGKILTWVEPGQQVERGDKLGMITWGSQTDLLIEESPGLEVAVEIGDYVYAGETVVATY